MSDITDLRAALFATLQGLKDGSCKPDQARAINDTAQTLVNLAKVEVDFMKATDQIGGSGFFGAVGNTQPRLPYGRKTETCIERVEAVTGGNVISHRMR